LLRLLLVGALGELAISLTTSPARNLIKRVFIGAALWVLSTSAVQATEGALGRPVAGTSVTANAGVIPNEPIWAVNVAEIYLDGSIGAGRQVPIAGQISLGIEGKAAFTLATVLKVWDTGPGSWNFASGITVPYIWTRATASLVVGGAQSTVQQSASDLFDLYFTPIAAGYHLSKAEHIALSFNVWAPTGSYDPKLIANASLNNWTFVPQVAYTKLWPDDDFEFDAVGAVQFYTRNTATDYRNASLFTLDIMALKRFANGASLGVIVETVQQLGHDSGPTADRLNGFVGRDLAAGPVIGYDTKIDGKLPLSASLRWVPTVYSENRLNSTRTLMGSISLIF
jgi:hypothetical protein